MDEKNENIINNSFISRGCSSAPRIYDKNDTIHSHGCCKLDSYDWLADIPNADAGPVFSNVEVRFKNSRLEFFHAPAELELDTGDVVAVEGSPGHDIGIISLTGEAARLDLIPENLPFDWPEIYSAPWPPRNWVAIAIGVGVGIACLVLILAVVTVDAILRPKQETQRPQRIRLLPESTRQWRGAVGRLFHP